MIRPDLAALHDTTRDALRDQLDDVVSAARNASALHVARLIVPTLRAVLDPQRYREDAFHARQGGDPIATRLLATFRTAMLEHRVYGFESIRLTLRAAESGGETRWARPGRIVEGACEWTSGVNGFGWEGHALVGGDDSPSTVGPCPTLLAWDEAPIDLFDWPRTIIPVVAIAHGPRRTVRVGGATDGGDLRVWVDDGGVRTEHRLAHGSDVVEKRDAGRDDPWRGAEVTPDCEKSIWPSSSWPASVAAELRERPVEALTSRLRIAHLKIEPTHVYVELRGDSDVEVGLVIFPRADDQRFLGSRRIAFGYRVREGEIDVTGLQRGLVGALRRVEARIASLILRRLNEQA